MPVSKIEAQDAIHGGLAEADAAWQQFLEAWNGPALVKSLKPVWARSDKETLLQSDPELYAKVSRTFSQLQA